MEQKEDITNNSIFKERKLRLYEQNTKRVCSEKIRIKKEENNFFKDRENKKEREREGEREGEDFVNSLTV